MYSGSDSTESQNYTQWALNPTNFQNVANEQVDWAALAQQWIIMKEAGPPVPEQTLTAPPAPIISKSSNNSVEGGEAPMDMEVEKNDSSQPWNEEQSSTQQWNWQQHSAQSPQWNYWPIPSGVPPPNSVKAPLLPTPAVYNQYSTAAEPSVDTNSFSGYTSATSADFVSQGYWTSTGNAKVIKPHNKRYSKVNVPLQPKPVTLDAAKRKQLPAWIREGLEKMEREKQKQVDKEKEQQEKKEYEDKMRLSEKETLEIIKSTVTERRRSRFESDEENSENETDGRPLTPEPVPITQEELMLKVRRTMTEILLKVTNREIHNICKEEIQRHLRKIRATDRHVSAPSGANLSARLGLGAYGGTGSSSEDSENESNQANKDSDTELKDIIKRRKSEFSKTEREIECRLAEAESKEENHSRQPSPDNSDNDSQVDAQTLGRKSRFQNSTDSGQVTKPPPALKRKKSYNSDSSNDSDSDRDRDSNNRSYNSSRGNRSSSSNSSQSNSHKRSRSSSIKSDDRKYKSFKSESDNRNRYDSVSKSNSYSRRSRTKSTSRKRKRSRSSSSRRNSNSKRYSRRSRSSSRSRRSYSRSSSRHRSYSYRSNRSRSRSRNRRSNSKSSRDYRKSSKRRSRSHSSHRYRRSRSLSSGRGKRSHRY